jgi:nitrogenase molybdenum-iron protein NifN
MNDDAVSLHGPLIEKQTTTTAPYQSTRNACKLCAPLGASIAYRGIEGCIPLIHGSQGCSTYIRRYTISHFREPIDIASSNFTENTAIFGGRQNLSTALDNLTRQYKPAAIGITSTCLSETIGEDVPRYLTEYRENRKTEFIESAEIVALAGGADLTNAVQQAETASHTTLPYIFYASTPSYKGTHMDGFHEAVRAAVSTLVPSRIKNNDSAQPPEAARQSTRINIISNFVSAEDLRELHSILRDYKIPYTLIPDYSRTLDGEAWEKYQKLSPGGTRISDIIAMGNAAGTVMLSTAVSDEHNAGLWLKKQCGVPLEQVQLPIGIDNTDNFFTALKKITGIATPQSQVELRGRLVDAYIDGHKYCYGKKAIVFGDEDFVTAVSHFLTEIGMNVVLAATGAAAMTHTDTQTMPVALSDETDFATMLEKADKLKPDFVMGNSKGYYIARALKIPHIRCGFPIHDRIGGQRILHLGYRGTLNLFDLVCNALMADEQSKHDNGYTYI